MTTIDAGMVLSSKRMKPGAVHDTFAMRGRVIWGVLLAAALVGGIGGWSATARLSGAIIGSGSVRVDQDLKVLQNIDGGVVREIAVRRGDQVVAGQVLLRLDDVQIQAERAILDGQFAELLARQARLIAERDGLDTMVMPADFLTQFTGAAAILSGEQQLFAGDNANSKSRRSQLELQIAQLHEQVNGLSYQTSALTAELTLVRDERSRVGPLVEKGLVESSRVGNLDRDIARMEGQIGEAEAGLAGALSKISEVKLQILNVGEILRTDSQRELRDIDARIAELQQKRAAVLDRLARTQIRSPVDGTVNELNVTTLGGVITPAEKLMTIVPADADLKVEFRVAIKDIDEITVGQQTKLRFSAFNRRTTPEVDGVVSRVSAAAERDAQTGETYYLAQINVTGDLAELGARGLIPGMPVEVFVKTAEQTAIAYFAKPFTDQVTRAFRED